MIRGSKAENHFSLVLIAGGEEQTENPHTDQELPQNKLSQHTVSNRIFKQENLRVDMTWINTANTYGQSHDMG